MGELEKELVEYAVNTRFEEIPAKTIGLAKSMVLNTLGAIIAGATVQGCPEAVEQCLEWGGEKEATIMFYGDRVPAHHAAFANSFMARAVGVDEALVPGLHVGGSAIPTGLAMAERAGGCSGKELLTAVILGSEIASRINGASVYNGFDPTGVCAVFASAAIAGRLLGLNTEQMWNALGHAFNRSGGSFQGTIDGSIAARVLQASVSQGGIISAQLAKRGISGPKNFLEGVYGYFHFYGGDPHDRQAVAEELGKRYELDKIFVKKYPSCGTTQSSIDAILDLMKEKGVTLETLDEVKVRVTPFTYNLTGKPFTYGENPKISAMYSIQYCVANALLRKSCKLRHFDEPLVREPRVMEVIDKIHVTADPALDQRNPRLTEMEVKMKDGATYHKRIASPRGTSENPLTEVELREKLEDCVSYGGKALSGENLKRMVSFVDRLEDEKDVRDLIPLLVSKGQS